MVSSALAAALARRNIHYGWIVVAVTFLTMLVTAGAMGAPGVLIVPLEREFDVSRKDGHTHAEHLHGVVTCLATVPSVHRPKTVDSFCKIPS